MDIPIQDELNAIVHKITNLLPEAKVYLFGSYATGMQKHDSDIDLCVVAPEYHEDRMTVLCSIRAAIRGTAKLPVDVLAFTDEEFERRVKWKSTIQYTVAKEGVLLNG